MFSLQVDCFYIYIFHLNLQNFASYKLQQINPKMLTVMECKRMDSKNPLKLSYNRIMRLYFCFGKNVRNTYIETCNKDIVWLDRKIRKYSKSTSILLWPFLCDKLEYLNALKQLSPNGIFFLYYLVRLWTINHSNYKKYECSEPQSAHLFKYSLDWTSRTGKK